MSKKNILASKQLMYSEYMNTNRTEHAVKMMEKKSKEKPKMEFTKSTVLPKIEALLEVMEAKQDELKTKPGSALNIEDVEEMEPFVELNVAVMNKVDDDSDELGSEHSNDDNRSSDSEDSNDMENGDSDSSNENSDSENDAIEKSHTNGSEKRKIEEV